MNQWHHMTWEEIGHLSGSSMDAALLPVGATEQHGPHLGCGMDSEIAQQLGLQVAQNTQVALLPTLPYGCSLGHSQRWPGTIALQPKTLIDVVKEIGDWVYASGFKRLFILNSHVSNFAPLRCALEMLRAEHDGFMVAIVNSATLSERVKKRHFEDADDWHANEAETSLMMAVAPQLVREERLKDSDDPDRTRECVFSHPVNRTSLNGVTGLPSLASAEKGEELFAWMVEDLSELVKKGLSEEAPLSHGYFDKVNNEN
ncbi:MAG: creatininase family protein [Thiomicrorhabdus chilensis]|uniref:creatininase family protein n=1 Tax=Thiomicrorhabdus chilensis TaxID=63656 RepID=UPI00299E2C73|nr:creatininase family protein [Thiomicrorhabdus chilensis]MDX1347660.1 creatininase family protein [Thiomicrorhabdus chilensis]